MAKDIRQMPADSIQDPGVIPTLEHNQWAGGKKVLEIGGHLVPLKYMNLGVIAYTTDATTARSLDQKGMCLAIYNNAGAVGAVTLGDEAGMAALAAGVTDANGNVGIPCPAGQWTKIACGPRQWVKTTAATLLVFVVRDDTYIRQENP